MQSVCAMHADLAIGLHVSVAKGKSARVGGGNAFLTRQVADYRAHLLQRPAQVHCRGTLLGEMSDGLIERCIGGIPSQGETDAVGCSGANQRSTTNLHGLDRAGRVLQRRKPDDGQSVRQPGLVDDLHRPDL